MSDTTFYKGSYIKDGVEGPYRGWLVGTFVDNGPRKTDVVEVKYWEYAAGVDTNHPTKTSSTLETTFILKGTVKAIIDNEEMILRAGDYVVIPPGLINNAVVETIEDAAGLTVKAPSDPSAKKIVA